MASNASTPAKDGPLSFMTPLNSCIAYFDPQAGASPTDPRLILVLSWMDARDVHVAKYILQHRVLFPSSRILLVRSTLSQFTRPASRRREQLQPAIPVLQQETAEAGGGGVNDEEEEEERRAELLVHVFSNGGVANAVALWDIWSSQPLPGGDASLMPRHVVVMDSCPGYFTRRRAHFAIASSLPGWASPLVHALLLATWLVYVAFGRPPPQDRNADAMNAAERVGREVRRAYLYGTGDEAVAATDVEAHARMAQGKGVEVRLERFEGGRHVAHVRVDGERYWRVVRESWEGEAMRLK